MLPLPWQHRIEPSIRLAQSVPKPRQFALRRDRVEFQQITEAAQDGSGPETQRIPHKLCRLHVLMAHPQTLGHFRDAAAIFRLAEAIDDGAFKIADVHGFLLCNPMLHRAEIVLWLDEDEAEFRPMDCLAPKPLRA